MRKHRFWGMALAIAAAASLAACSKPGDDAAKKAAKEVEAIRAGEVQWNADFKAKDVEKVVSHYASAGVLLLPGQTPTRGSDQLRWVMKQMFADANFALTFAPQRIQTAAANDIAFSEGTFKQTSTDPATHQAATASGAYVTIYRRAANGTWKAIEDIITPTSTAPAEPKGPLTVGKFNAAVEPTTEGEAVKALEAQWAAAWKARDAAKVTAQYAPDAIAMFPGMPALTGKDAIAAAVGDALKDPAFDLQFSADQVMVSASGDLAYTRGTLTTKETDPKTHKTTDATGSYVAVYRHEADNSWKTILLISTPGQAAAAAPAK